MPRNRRPATASDIAPAAERDSAIDDATPQDCAAYVSDMAHQLALIALRGGMAIAAGHLERASHLARSRIDAAGLRARLDQLVGDGVDQRLERSVDDVGADAHGRPALPRLVG